jgi:phage portal protein BeeE
MLLGIPGDNTCANCTEANAAFWRGAVPPLAARIAGALGAGLAPTFGDQLRLWFDVDQVHALSTDREALWARVAAADFRTVNEKRAAVGYEAVQV